MIYKLLVLDKEDTSWKYLMVRATILQNKISKKLLEYESKQYSNPSIFDR